MKIINKTKKLLKEFVGYFIAMIIFFAIVSSILGSFIMLLCIVDTAGIKLSGFVANYFLIQTAIATVAIAWAVVRSLGRKKKSDSA